MAYAGLVPLALGARGQDGLGEGGVGREFDPGLADRDGVRGFANDHHPLQLRAHAQVNIERDVGDIGLAGALIAFQQHQLCAGLQDQGPGRMVRRGVGRRNETQGQRPLMARLDGQGARPFQLAPIEEHDLLVRQVAERAALELCRVRRRRGGGNAADQAAQIRPAPVLLAAARELGDVACLDGAGQSHAASRAYLS